MMGIGFTELMIILVIIMIVFGAGKLPSIGTAFGNTIKNFKKSMKEAEEPPAVDNPEVPALDSGAENDASAAAEQPPPAADPGEDSKPL